MRKYVGVLFKGAIAISVVALFCAGGILYKFLYQEMSDDELFAIAEKALNTDCMGVQLEVDAILSDNRIKDNGTLDEWGQPYGFAKGSKLYRFSSRLPNFGGWYSLCRMNGKICIRIRYGWPRSLADIVMYHSKERVVLESKQRLLNQHVLIYRVIRHD